MKAPSDSQIASDITAKLNGDSGLQYRSIKVQVVNGTVTLSGAVDNDRERDAAMRYASSVEGVKVVVSNLQVEQPMPAAMPTPRRRHPSASQATAARPSPPSDATSTASPASSEDPGTEGGTPGVK